MSDSLKAMQEAFVSLEAFEQLYRAFKIVFYRPIGQQPQFHSASRASIRLVLGSNRSGKSVSGTAEAIAHSKGYRAWLDEDHPDRIVRMPNGDPIPVPNIGRVIAENFNVSITQTIEPKFREWAPESEIKSWKRDQRGVLSRIDWNNGSVTHFMAYQQDIKVFEGTNGHWAWFDEPPPRDIFIAIRRGLIDFGGHCWLTMTPLGQPWIHDDIFAKAGDHGGERIKIFKYSIWDNCIDQGGYLSRTAIEDFLSDLSEEEMEARLHGNFMHLAGRVFKEWDPDVPFYVPTDAVQISPRWPRVCIIDPHGRKPMCVVWIAFSPSGVRYVYRDLFDRHLRTVHDVAERIKELEGWDDPDRPTENIVMRIIDTSANEVERIAGESIKQRFWAEGILCTDAYKRNYWSGIDAIKADLRVRSDWQVPGLIVLNTCYKTKSDFMRFCYDEWQTSRQRDSRGAKEEVRKIDDDAIDCIRYTYQMGLSYERLSGMQKISGRDTWDDASRAVRGITLTQPGLSSKEKKWPTSRGRKSSRVFD